jgi:hypothetical protein
MFRVINYPLIFICGSTQPFVGPRPHFSFLIFYTVGRAPLMGDQLVARPLPSHTGQHLHRINAHTDICASSGIRTYDPSVWAGTKTVYLLDRAATVIGTRNRKIYRRFHKINRCWILTWTNWVCVGFEVPRLRWWRLLSCGLWCRVVW